MVKTLEPLFEELSKMDLSQKEVATRYQESQTQEHCYVSCDRPCYNPCDSCFVVCHSPRDNL